MLNFFRNILFDLSKKVFYSQNTLNFSILSEKLLSLKRRVSMDVDLGQAFKFVFLKPIHYVVRRSFI